MSAPLENPLTFASPHVPAFIGDPVDDLARTLGLPADQIRLVACLLAAIPLGWIHTLLPLHASTLKHLYSAILGFAFSYFVVGWQFLHVFCCSLVVYFLCLTLSRKYLTPVVFIFSLSYLSGTHIHRVLFDYLGWSLDFSMLFMVYCVKSHTLACNYVDGLALNKNEKLSEKDWIHQFRAERAIRKFPSLLEYLSFMFYYGGVLVGPCFEIKEYLQFNDGTLFTTAGLKSVPSTVLPSLKTMGKALLCYVGVFLSTSYLPIMGYMNTPEFTEQTTFLYRLGYCWVSTVFFRFKYYFAWYFGEAGCVASGLGFAGLSKHQNEIHWNRVTNCNAWMVESAPSMPVLTNYWNMGVNNWLKNYVYYRVETPKSLRKLLPGTGLNNLITKLTSAFWHGFYPAYYLFFFSAYFANLMDDAFRPTFEPYFFQVDEKGKTNYHAPKSTLHYLVYRVLGYFLVLGCMNYYGVSFLLLRWDWSLKFWASLYYSFHILPFVVIGLCAVMPKKRVKKHAAETNGNGATKKQQ